MVNLHTFLNDNKHEQDFSPKSQGIRLSLGQEKLLQSFFPSPSASVRGVVALLFRRRRLKSLGGDGRKIAEERVKSASCTQLHHPCVIDSFFRTRGELCSKNNRKTEKGPSAKRAVHSKSKALAVSQWETEHSTPLGSQQLGATRTVQSWCCSRRGQILPANCITVIEVTRPYLTPLTGNNCRK